MQKSFTLHHFSDYNIIRPELKTGDTNHRNGGGFTLIEIIVVTGIIIFLSAIVLLNYRAGESQLALQRSVHKLAQDIRRAQEMAMSAKEITGPTGRRIVPVGGYGIFFRVLPNPPYYEIILFADCNNDQRYTLGKVCGTAPNKFSEKIKNLNLESGVKMSNLSPSSPLHITFKPPDPAISISGGNLAVITLSLETDPTKTKTIRVNKAGLIYVE